MNNLNRLKEILTFAYHSETSDLYRKKYDAVGAGAIVETFADFADLSKLPLLQKAELTSARPGQLQFLADKDIKLVYVSSGTTGKPMVCRYSMKTPTIDPLDQLGDGAVMVLLPPNLGASIYSRLDVLYKKGLVMLGDLHNLPSTCAVAAQVNTTAITTTPTLAVLLRKYVAEQPQLEKSLKYFRLMSEFFTASKKEYLRQLYPGVTIHASYASSEALKIAYQCQCLAEATGHNYYHPHLFEDSAEPVLHIEVLDPESHEPVAQGEVGELVVTNLYNKALPLIRYQTGDLVSLHENTCPCGASGPLMRTHGRVNHDMVRAAGFELRRNMFEPAIFNCKEVIDEQFEIFVYEEISNGVMSLRFRFELVLADGESESMIDKRSVAAELMKQIRISPNFTLFELKEKGVLQEIEIVFVPKRYTHKSIGRIHLR